MALIFLGLLLLYPLWQLIRALRIGVVEGVTFEVRRGQAPAAFWANVAVTAAVVLGGVGIIGLSILR